MLHIIGSNDMLLILNLDIKKCMHVILSTSHVKQALISSIYHCLTKVWFDNFRKC